MDPRSGLPLLEKQAQTDDKWYAELTKMCYDAVNRHFCDAILLDDGGKSTQKGHRNHVMAKQKFR
jgi:hypothetical protein